MEDRAPGGTMCVGTMKNIADVRGNEGETGESVLGMVLVCRPRPLEG